MILTMRVETDAQKAARLTCVFCTLQPEIVNGCDQQKSIVVGVVDKDGEEGNYYFPVITFGEMFFL